MRPHCRTWDDSGTRDAYRGEDAGSKAHSSLGTHSQEGTCHAHDNQHSHLDNCFLASLCLTHYYHSFSRSYFQDSLQLAALNQLQQHSQLVLSQGLTS